MTDSLEFSIRKGAESDYGFVADSWVQTLRGASKEARAIPKELFFPHEHERIGLLLPTCDLRVAGPPEDEVTIYGFSVCGRGVVHFTYVKSAFRKLGIARALLKDYEANRLTVSTSWSRDLGEWILSKYPQVSYCPWF